MGSAHIGSPEELPVAITASNPWIAVPTHESCPSFVTEEEEQCANGILTQFHRRERRSDEE